MPRNHTYDNQNPLQTQVRINIDSVMLEMWISVIMHPWTKISLLI